MIPFLTGNDISITFTVKNYGTGVTAVNSWYDQILWSNDAFFSKCGGMVH